MTDRWRPLVPESNGYRSIAQLIAQQRSEQLSRIQQGLHDRELDKSTVDAMVDKLAKQTQIPLPEFDPAVSRAGESSNQDRIKITWTYFGSYDVFAPIAQGGQPAHRQVFDVSGGGASFEVSTLNRTNDEVKAEVKERVAEVTTRWERDAAAIKEFNSAIVDEIREAILARKAFREQRQSLLDDLNSQR
jgi:hypothetical protein